jgi:diguanylate cyclase (GGDEF)-like protein
VAAGMAAATAWMMRRLSLPLYRKLAYTDLLSGVYNRNAFEQDSRLVQEHERDGDMVVLSCDLNLLKTVNDQGGHAAGDAYIRALANLLVGRFGMRGRIYRTGGDEFVVLLRNASQEDVEKEMAEVYECAREIQISGFRLFFAYGMARFDPQLDKDAHDTLARADAEMYSHKRGAKRAMGLDLR